MKYHSICRHCKKKRLLKSRWLCWTCYNTCAIRNQYNAWYKPEPELEVDNTELPLPEPTIALPGTKAKVETLCARSQLGQELWHAGDAAFILKECPSDHEQSKEGSFARITGGRKGSALESRGSQLYKVIKTFALKNTVRSQG